MIGEWLASRSIRYAVLTGAALRILWASLVPVIPFSDPAAYDAFARTLAEHGVFGWTPTEPHAFWPPGTTFLHAAVYSVFGPSYPAIVALNILVSLGLIVTTARVAGRFFGSRVGDLAAWTIALWPTLILYVTVLASELPFVLLMTLALDAWTNDRLSATTRGVLSGILLGAAALVRPLALALPFVFAIATILPATDYRAVTRRVAITLPIALVAMATVIAPWSLRNQKLFGETVLVSTNGGITFWMGNTPGTDGSYMPVPDELANVPDDEQEKILSSRAWEYIRNEPGAFAIRTIQKIVKLYSNESIGVGWNVEGIRKAFGPKAEVPLKRFTQITWAALFAIGLIGIWSSTAAVGLWKTLVCPAFATVAYFSLIHGLTVSQDRYHLSFASLLAVYIALGLSYLIDRGKPSHGSRFDELR